MARKATGNIDPKLAYELRYYSNLKTADDSTQTSLNTAEARETKQKLSLQTQFQVSLRLNDPLMLTLCMVFNKVVVGNRKKNKGWQTVRLC